MKLFINFNEEERFRPRVKHLEHLDFSLFLDTTPKSQDDLSSINIMVLAEPN